MMSEGKRIYNKGPRRDDKYGLARVKYTGNLIPARSLDTRRKKDTESGCEGKKWKRSLSTDTDTGAKSGSLERDPFGTRGERVASPEPCPFGDPAGTKELWSPGGSRRALKPARSQKLGSTHHAA